MATYKTIGFFGDSFCADLDSKSTEYETYISMLARHYDAEIVHLGLGGSSVGDLIMFQLMPLIEQNKVPDICVFAWTDFNRLFHRERDVRRLHINNVRYKGMGDPVWEAARQYYNYLYDPEFAQLQCTALLEYVDNNILPKLPSNTKIVHLWSFGIPKALSQNGFDPKILEYAHTWKNGIEIRPSLMSIAMMDDPITGSIPNQDGPNHLVTKSKNEIVFNYVKNAINSYGN